MTELIDQTDLAMRCGPVAERWPTGTTRPLFLGESLATGRILETHQTTASDNAWAERIASSLHSGEYAVCVLSFTPGGAAIGHRIAASAEPLERLRALPSTTGSEPADRRHSVVEVPSPVQYAENVRVALDRIGAGQVDKVVLGRGVDVVSDPPIDPAEIVGRLLTDRPGRYVFAVPLDTGARPRLLVGASPELLVRRAGRSVTSFPLAGSVPRSNDPAEDRERAEALRRSNKDLTEHAYVVDAIVAALAPHCAEVHADPRPRLVSTDTLHHLGSSVSATLAPGAAPTALDLARLLHPTPAVGGVPTTTALDVITELEPDRGPLAGTVGWVDADGDGEFAVTIRAGVLDGERLHLFAGAGIVAASDPDAEVRETGAKLDTMRRAVGV